MAVREIQTVKSLRLVRGMLTGSVGLVPTMGYLHEGHLSLIQAARRENDSVIVTIFVNPTQFGPNEDLSRYPRDRERDFSLLDEAGVDLVFIPSVDEIYPKGFSSSIDLGPITQRLEGASRPGHFQGVATIVAKLFNLTQPDRAYFGQKDAQQCAVIRKLVSDLNFSLELRFEPTVRESDGLAMSSRNFYLSPEERQAAVAISRALFRAKECYDGGLRQAETLRRMVRDEIGREPLAKLEYASLADALELEEIERQNDGQIEREAVLSLACRFGRTRLIDNIVLG